MPRIRRRTARSAAALIQACLAWVARICFRRAPYALAAIAALVLIASVGVTRVTLDPDISELLPATHQSVRNLEALRDRFGGVGYVALLVRGGTPQERRDFADHLVPELERLPSVRYASARAPVDFFRDRALYFLDAPDLDQVRERLEARQRYDIERAMLDLDDEPPPSLGFDDLRQKYEARLQPGAQALSGSGYCEDELTLLIVVRPVELASNLAFTRQVVADVQSVVDRVRHEPLASNLTVDLAGRYKKRVDLQDVLNRDLAWTSSLALVLVLAYVALHFRRWLAVILVMAPLLIGMQLSYGFAGFAFGTLNVLTAFVGAILLGIGIDNGIHLLGRYDEARQSGNTAEAAVVLAFADAGRVSTAAALCIAAAFGCLALSDFLAFREFGVLMAVGMLLLLISYVTLLPALLGVVARSSPTLLKPPRTLELPGIRFGIRHARPLMLIVGGLCLALIAVSPAARFNADFSALDRADAESFRLDPTINRLLGRSQTPLVFLTHDHDEARKLAGALRSRMTALEQRATIGLVSTLGDWVPDEQQEKQQSLRQIRRVLSRIDRSRLSQDEQHRFDEIWRMSAATPFTADDLPETLRKQLAPSGSHQSFVLAHPIVGMGDATAVLELERQLTGIAIGQRQLTAAGEPMVMAEILRIVRQDAPQILLLTMILILGVLRVLTGQLQWALLSLLPALATLGATAGLLALFGIELNYINMIMLPILLGIGVDDALHIVTRVMEGDPIARVWGFTGWNILGAILTDLFGFGALAFASHPGLASLGKVAIVGLTMNLLLCVVLLPTLLVIVRRQARPSRAPEGQRVSFLRRLASGR